MQAAAFIIHLERAVSRKPQVDWLKSNLPIAAEILPAVDGAKLTAAEKKSVYQRHIHRPHYPFALRDAEIGCFLSHRNTWAEIVKRNLDYGLIVEDDITLEPEVFMTAYALATRHISDAGYIRFPWFDKEKPASVLDQQGNTRLFTAKRTGLGMLAQLVSQSAARHLLEATQQFDRPVDTMLQMHWVTKQPIASVFPSGVSEISANLGGSTIGRKKSLGQKLRHEILRPWYKSQIAIRNSIRHDPNG